MTTTSPIKRREPILQAILTAGLVAGMADGLAAITNFYLTTGRGPALIFKYIASAVFGKTAFEPGSLMIVLGVIFHLLIALIFTTIFFFLYPRVALLRKNKVVVGLSYGIIVWAVMMIVVRLSRIPNAPIHWDKAIIQILILMFCIGLPVSLFANHYYRRNPAADLPAS